MSAPQNLPIIEARDEPGRVVLAIRVTPRARRQALSVIDGRLRAWVRAAPVEGAANAALIALLAERLSLPPRDITLLRGETARQKQVAVVGQSSDSIRHRLRLDPA